MEKEFNRTDGVFSLCGLNCGLCPMKIRGGCSGCFNGSTCYQTCPIAACSIRHGNVDYSFQCSKYPCKRYDGIDEHDSLISHKNQKKDLAKAKENGIEDYLDEQRKKKEILTRLLDEYDDGGRDVFFCLAVNMLGVNELLEVLSDLDRQSHVMSLVEKADNAEMMLCKCAENKDIPLELRP